MLALLLASALTAQSTTPQMWSEWCARCHAEDGSGKVSEPTISVVPMDFTDCAVASGEPDADWARAVAKGGAGVGLSPEMPAFEDSVRPGQIAALVSHMRGFCKERGWPSGNTNFPRPILTAKAFPENELVILPAVSHWNESPAPSLTAASLIAVYERRVGRRSMVEIAVPLVSTNVLTTWTSGIGDVALALTHAIFERAAAPRIVSVGVEASLPSGDRFKAHGSGTVVFEPFVAAGAMARGWYVQSQLKVELPVNSARADRTFAYNAYVGRDSGMAPNAWTIGLEVNGATAFPRLGVVNHLVALTPQVRKGLTGTGALAASAGVMLPVNKRDAQGVRWVGYLLWEYLEPWRSRR